MEMRMTFSLALPDYFVEALPRVAGAEPAPVLFGPRQRRHGILEAGCEQATASDARSAKRSRKTCSLRKERRGFAPTRGVDAYEHTLGFR